MKSICYQCKNEYTSKDLELYDYDGKAFYCCTSCRYDLIQYKNKKNKAVN